MTKTGLPVEGLLCERESRRPIAGAAVSLSSTGGSHVSARTDRLGRFKGFVRPGEISLALEYAGPYVFAQGSKIKIGTIETANEPLVPGVFEVVPGIEIRGVVRDEAGKPALGGADCVPEIGGWHVRLALDERNRAGL